MNRRDALKMTAATVAASMISGNVFAQSKPLRVLILGGTGFIGPHFVDSLRSAGHKLTLFNRGKRNPGLFPDVEQLLGDRHGQVDALKNRDWDVVIDNSGYLPKDVKLTADLLKGHTQYYLFISSISAYADLTPPGIDEDYKLAELKDPNSEDISANYGALKAVCEQTVEKTYGNACSIVRPTYIVGPGDTTDRFTYWPLRASRGGEMLVPGTPSDPVQFIDVRDLADFVRLCVEQRIPGQFNACNPPGAVTMVDVLDTAKRITKANTRYTWVDVPFVEAQKLTEGNELPIWAPTTGEYAGAALVSSARAVAKGLRFRDLDTTVADTLAWQNKRPAEQQQKLRAGLTAEREAELLKLWHQKK
ncbi:2'-hydroxyisoflavone reductase [Povalibacter uvarum]|uniref:2'-hydroxyisoflavone reductase n=1 Tax=Povalibacter uvarum TaxID=732238 RepID=A0A841HX90_9GAMM|nr:NAD-dependent epimerase/dehydratase family protein [Povalibacter uvarum]MBB6096572.1 2'-hydroxyisoflavone reductase [Povalibacter uvarum]